MSHNDQPIMLSETKDTCLEPIKVETIPTKHGENESVDKVADWIMGLLCSWQLLPHNMVIENSCLSTSK